MSDAPTPGGAMRPDGAPRSRLKGDVPEPVARRYYTDERGGRGLGFYVDARIAAPAFRDEGRRLVASRNDPNVARDLARIARHRGWSMVVVRGDPDFRRELWLAARTVGIEVRGYRPTDRDVQDLARLAAARDRGAGDAGRAAPTPDPSRHEPRLDTRTRSILRVVAQVVGARIRSPEVQARILSEARERLTRSVQPEDRAPPSRSGATVDHPPRRERIREA